MTRFVLAPVVVSLALLAFGSPASAQLTYPIQGAQRYPGWQTPLSPWLRMLVPGNSAINYYQLVQPEFQRRQDRNVMYQSIQSFSTRLPPPPGIAEEEFDKPMHATGHPTAFGYTGNYFGGGAGTMARNPFPQRQQQQGQGRRRAGPRNRWPTNNRPQPAGQQPRRYPR